MTDLSALKEAVKRRFDYKHGVQHPSHIYDWRSGAYGTQYKKDIELIADALLSQEPVTRTALEELGFACFHGRETDTFAFDFTGGRVVAWESCGEWLFNYIVDGNEDGWLVARPQPKHVGALLSLLLWLEEQK